MFYLIAGLWASSPYLPLLYLSKDSVNYLHGAIVLSGNTQHYNPHVYGLTTGLIDGDA